MEHLDLIENLLYGAMEASNDQLDELMLITACGKVKAKEGETFEESFERTCDEMREEFRAMWEKISFYHTGIHVSTMVHGETIYDEL